MPAWPILPPRQEATHMQDVLYLMQDVLYLGLALAFLALSWGLVELCDRL
jgi:hypothetical protein